MRHRLLLAGILQLLTLPALAAAGAGAHYAAGARHAAARPVSHEAGVVPLTRDAQVAYELDGDDAGVRGNVTTWYRLSKTEMLNLRLEKEGGGAFWSRRHRGREQRLGLFPARFGLADHRVFGWEYADGYALAEEAPRGGTTAWAGTPMRVADRPPLGAAMCIAGEDGMGERGIGERIRAAFASEHDRIADELRADSPLPAGRRDLKFAAGGSAATGGPFLGGALRQGLTSAWTVEAGGYTDRSARVYAASRVRLGGGVLKLETRSDDASRQTARRAAYVFGPAALAVERRNGGGSVGARLYGSRYYAAVDRGVGDGDSRVALGYATKTRFGRMAFQCEARAGHEDARYCGVGLQLPLQRGASGATTAARRFFGGEHAPARRGGGAFH